VKTKGIWGDSFLKSCWQLLHAARANSHRASRESLAPGLNSKPFTLPFCVCVHDTAVVRPCRASYRVSLSIASPNVVLHNFSSYSEWVFLEKSQLSQKLLRTLGRRVVTFNPSSMDYCGIVYSVCIRLIIDDTKLLSNKRYYYALPPNDPIVSNVCHLEGCNASRARKDACCQFAAATSSVNKGSQPSAAGSNFIELTHRVLNWRW